MNLLKQNYPNFILVFEKPQCTIRTTKNDRKLENTVKSKEKNWCDYYRPL